MLERSHKYLKEKKHEIVTASISDMIEQQQIIHYIEEGLLEKIYVAEDINYYSDQIKKLKKQISQYFQQLDGSIISSFFEEIDVNYTDAFWLLVNRHKTYNNISPKEFEIILDSQRCKIREILKYKNVVEAFDKEITNKILSKVRFAEVLINYADARKEETAVELYFPKSLSLQKREEVVLAYIASERPNVNYLRLIEKTKNKTPHLNVSDRTKLKAKKRADAITEEFLSSEYAITVTTGVSLSEDQEEVKKIIKHDGHWVDSYSKKFLAANTEIGTIINNFRNVFEYLDFQGCISFVSKKSDIDGWDVFRTRAEDDFLLTTVFHNNSLTSLLRLEIYLHFFKETDIDLEDIVSQFVNKNLNNDFNIDSLKLQMPGRDLKSWEKIRSLAPEFEALLEQYKLYVEDDFVDYELIRISTKTTKFSEVPSLLEKKYVYPVFEGDFQKLRYIFFDYMSDLFDYEKYNGLYDNFYQVLRSEKVNVSDYSERAKMCFQHFIGLGYLSMDESGFISFTNKDTITVIGYLFTFEVISYWHFPKLIRDEIDNMAKNKIVRFSDKLFTDAEQQYFDYYLNNRFSNGLWLRNKYVHATNTDDPEEQERDYKIVLKLLILLILKIKDDLELAKKRFKPLNNIE